ncbi:MAG: HAD-IA family hydrolase [Gammaproteobacteria bacterium]|jgi:phosphoglycolate phosphatase
MKHARYNLLVFDWDGTLIDSIERIVTSLQHASHKVCGAAVSEDQARSVIGLGLREALEQLLPELDSGKIELLADAYRQDFLYDSKVPERLFAGVNELLDQLAADDYSLAIATGKSRIGLDRAIQKHRLDHYFITTRCAGENKSKPHPEMLNSILHELNTATTNTVMIGDSSHDMLMAGNAGIEAIGVTHGVENVESLMLHNPITCLDNITDLYEFLSHNTQHSFNTKETVEQ